MTPSCASQWPELCDMFGGPRAASCHCPGRVASENRSLLHTHRVDVTRSRRCPCVSIVRGTEQGPRSTGIQEGALIRAPLTKRVGRTVGA